MLKHKPKIILICLAISFILTNNIYGEEAVSKEDEAIFVAKKAFQDRFYEVSLDLLERFSKNYPDSTRLGEVKLLIAQCYFHQSRFLDALNLLEPLLEDPKAKDIKDAVLYWIAEIHFKGNNFDKSATFYKRIIDEFPKSNYVPIAYYSLGWCLFQERKFQDALQYFKTVEEKYSSESQLIKEVPFKIVECLYNLKDYAALKEKINLYIKNYSKDTFHLTYFYFYLAEADYYIDNFEQAIGEYAKVLSTTSDENIKALSKLGQAWSYLKLKRYKEAGDSFADIKTEKLEKRSLDVLLLGKAILMSETSRLNEARDVYSELIKTTSEDAVLVQAYLGKADVLYNLAEYEEAIKVYQEALKESGSKSFPQDIIDKLHYSLAWAFLKQGNFKEAIQEFRKVVKSSEDEIVRTSALCQIGDTYQDTGDYIKAQEAYDNILKNYPDSFYSDYVQYQLGLTFLKNSNYDGAILSFLALKKNYPQSKLLDDAAYALGLTYLQKQDYALSKEVFEKFEEEFKESNLKPQALYLLGTSLFNLSKFNEAIEVFKNIIRLYGQDAELAQKAEYEIADCHYQMGDEKEAMNRFKALRSKYPDSALTAEIMWWLGDYYYRHNDLTLARRYFSSLIKDFPKSPLVLDAYYAIGSTYQEEGNETQAIESFKKVMEIGKSDLTGQAAVAIADIYARQDKADLALKTYKDSISDYPNLGNLIYPKMADLFLRIKDYNQALEFYQKSMEVISLKEMSGIQLKIAEVLELQGKKDEALEEYLKVTYLYTQNKELAIKAFFRVASIYEDKENFAEASNIYKKIISLNVGEAKYAQERLDWIKTRAK